MEIPVDGRLVVVAVVLVAAGAGAVVLLDDGSTVDPADTVPAADAVVVVDGEFVTHPTTTRIADEALERAGTRYRFEQLLDAAETRVGLRPDRVQWVTAFARYPEQTRFDPDLADGYAGVVVRADWTERTLVDSARTSDIDVEERTYQGRSVYRLGQPAPTPDVYVAVLAPNTYALSTTERVVQDAIDASEGDDGLSTGLRQALSDRRDEAAVRAAARVPADALAGVDDRLERAPAVDRVAVGYNLFNDTHLGVRTTLYATDADDAETLRALLSAGLTFAGPQVENATIGAALDDVTVSRAGSRVDLSYRDDVDTVIALGGAAVDRLRETVGERTPVDPVHRPPAAAVATVNTAAREEPTCATC